MNESRENFRNGVFKRDGYRCVVPRCVLDYKDAHHLIERRLWVLPEEKEGYFLDNGVTVCEYHHQLAEKNVICPEAFRVWAGITTTALPHHLDPEKDYNKWGIELKTPTREWAKYPSTPYLPFSESILPNEEPTSIPIACPEDFVGVPLVITMKMDGSNVVLTDHHVASRNGYEATHRSFDQLKAIHSTIQHLIPNNTQIFGEWLYARHSIHYIGELSLPAYLQIFGVYDRERKLFLGWDDVEYWAKRIHAITVPKLSKQIYENKYEFTNKITEIAKRQIRKGHEGIVVRSAFPMHFGQFHTYVGKYVRAHHVQTSVHWKEQKIVKNDLVK
jgi:hypothetical protein